MGARMLRLRVATSTALAIRSGTVHVRRMRRRDLLIRLGLVGAAAGGAWWFRDYVLWREPEIVLPDAGDTGWLPYAEPRVTTPTVGATVNGTPVRALIDSGAQYSVIDRGLFQTLGLTDVFRLPMVAYGVGGDAQVGRGVTLDVGVGGLALKGLRAAILGLGPLAGPQGLAAPLILGQDVLRHLVLDLDAPERRLRFWGRDGWTPPAEVRPIAVTRNGRALQTAITVEGTEVQAVVDTGASAVLAVTRETARAAGLLDGRDSRPGQSIVLGGVVRADTVVARTLKIGDDLHRDAEVAIYDDVAAPGFPKALIGMEAFAGRRLALDLGGPRLFASRALDITVGGPVRPR